MVDAAQLLQGLKRLLRNVEDDLDEVHADSAESRGLRAEWQVAREAGRTGETLRYLQGRGADSGRRTLDPRLSVPALHRGQRLGRAPLAGWAW